MDSLGTPVINVARLLYFLDKLLVPSVSMEIG